MSIGMRIEMKMLMRLKWGWDTDEVKGENKDGEWDEDGTLDKDGGEAMVEVKVEHEDKSGDAN